MMAKMRAVILGNGTWGNQKKLISLLKKSDYLIACDGGFTKARRAGISPHMVIGDLDSLTIKNLSKTIQIIQFPEDKNETDGELALQFALKNGFREILWYAPFGGRWDQSMANLFLIIKAAKLHVPLTLIQGKWEIFLVLKEIHLSGKTGEEISLMPLSKTVTGIQASGFKYPANNLTLSQGETRGISNKLSRKKGRITIKKGWLLVFHKYS
jgi:thiamine pyrophosphokinase